MNLDRHPHFLRSLSTDSMPRRHVFLDTESRTVQRGGQAEQRWRLACALFTDTDPRLARRPETLRDFSTPLELWDAVEQFTRHGRRTCVWTHNLGYDLRVSNALGELPARGYQLDGIVLERTASWATFRRRDETIMFCDLFAHLPAPLRDIARDVGLAKPPLPDDPSDLGALRERCRADVRVLAAAALQLMGWIEHERLGPFRPTGAGQAWAAYRRRFMRQQLLVHDDGAALAAERRAMWTGRAEAWRWGQLPARTWTEYDLRSAYCHIAAGCVVPTVLVGRGRPRRTAAGWELPRDCVALCHVRVRTDAPLVPCERDGYVVWPVGEFDTWLWQPELDLLHGRAAEVEVIDGYLYRSGAALAEFAEWVLDRLDAPGRQVPLVAKRALKHWGRALVGRMGMRYRRWEEWATADRMECQLGTLLDLETGESTDLLHVGHDLRALTAYEEPPVSLPQVTGYVMSECRRRLWLLAETAGLEDVVYMDTDSLIVTHAGRRRLDAAIDAGRAWSLRRKGTYHDLDIRGPRNLTVQRAARISGVPKKARRVGPLDFEGEVWRSLRESIVRGELDHVATTERTWRPLGRDVRRLHLPAGETRPYRM